MAKSKLKLASALAVTMGFSLVLCMSPANAMKKGPRASVDVQTTCALDGTHLSVTVDVANKTSGEAIAVVDAYSITPVYKSLSEKGNTTTPIPGLGVSSDTNTPVNEGITITQSFLLCDSLMSLPADLRGINAEVSVTYGKDDGAGGVVDTRTIMNRCSDDPATDEEEPAGIKINYDELATACAAP